MRRCFCVAMALLMTFALLVSVVPMARAAERIPYVFSVDQVDGNADRRASGDKLAILREIEVPFGENLTVRGWFATPAGVQSYEYACVPAGGGAAEWKAADASVHDRPDLGQAGIAHATGHKTAGFVVTVPLSEGLSSDGVSSDGLSSDGLSEGYYDVYLRAVLRDGTTCDFLAFVRLRYGSPDLDDGDTCTISMERLAREGEDSLRGGATVEATGIRLPVGGSVRLGQLHLPAMERLIIRYTTDAATEGGDRRAILGLKRTGDHPYGTLGGACDMTDSLVYAPLSRDGHGELVLDLSEIGYSGDVWLTGSLAGEVTVTEVVFYYNGKGTDHVAAKLQLSGDTASYLSGQNQVTAQGIYDETVGDCLRVEVVHETNDPYVHFSAGLMLEDNGIRLDADEYKYMVLLLRASPENVHSHMTLYLCAGTITGATEACTKSFTLKKDGAWHYYLLDLTATENWMGIINGWRFDIINGDSLPGNRVDIATVQFFRTAEAAEAAAAEDPNGVTPYKIGDPAVIHDMREEAATDDTPYTVPPEDVFVETTPDTQPSEETDTRPIGVTGEAITLPSGEPVTTPSGSESASVTEAGTDVPKGGCTSALSMGGLLCLLAVSAGGILSKKLHEVH